MEDGVIGGNKYCDWKKNQAKGTRIGHGFFFLKGGGGSNLQKIEGN